MPEDKTPILSRLRAPQGSVKVKHRVGRGPGSGWGTTAGRGQKGQYARNTVRPGFEGGQTPLYRRLPKIGFKNPFSKNVATVNVERLGKFDANSVVDELALRAAGLVRGTVDSIKVKRLLMGKVVTVIVNGSEFKLEAGAGANAAGVAEAFERARAVV